MVFDTIRRSMLAGLGLVVITGEQIRKTVESLVEAGKLSQEEGEKLVRDITDMSKERSQDVQGRIRDSVRQAMDNIDIGSRREFIEISARVRSLEERLSVLEAARIGEMRGQTEKKP